jgi:hypothetical protein
MSRQLTSDRCWQTAARANTANSVGIRGGNWSAVACCALAAFWTALFSLVTIKRVKDVVVVLVLNGRPVEAAPLFAALGSVDALLALLAGITSMMLVVVELRGRSLSRFLMTATPTQAFWTLTIIAAWTGHAYLSPGVLLGGDTATHVSRFLEVARGLGDGTLPTWTNDQYLGAPLLWFTGPLTYIVGGGIAALTGNPTVAIKIVLFASHMTAAWLFFAFMRRLDFQPIPAMVAAAGFAGCFAHLHLFLYRGVVPQALTISFLVLLFHTAEGLMAARGRVWANWFGVVLATAGLIVNHQPHALFAAFYLAVFGGVSLVLGRWQWSGLPRLATGALCGAVISAVAVLPVLTESDWVMIEPGGAQIFWHVPTLVRLAHLVMWRDTRTTWGFDYWAYLGITLIVVAAIGVRSGFGTKAKRRPLLIATLAGLAFSLFLFNPVVRDVIFMMFLLAILVAMGIEQLALTDRRAGRTVLMATALVFVDICSTSVQPVARTDKGFAIEAGRTLERTARNERMMELDYAPDSTLIADVGPDSGPVYYDATVQRIAGNHNMAATRVHNYAMAAAKLAEADLRRDKTLTADSQRLLELLNVTRVVCLSPISSGCPANFGNAVSENGLGRIVKLSGVPVLFSQQLEELAPGPNLDKPMFWSAYFAGPEPAPAVGQIEDFLRKFADAERSMGSGPMGAAIAVRKLSGETRQHDAGWKPIVTRYDVGLERVEIGIESNGTGYAQLAHPWFPATEVRLDGNLIQPIQGSINLMVVPVHQGQNRLELRPGTTPIRRYSGWLSLFGLLLAAAGTFYLRRRDPSVRA